ncbi:hypothetical protein FHN55_10870 [Streptomyces sp. NP160]|uniref:hypothetical protein n=1 Tax=Streptomyces sp. NP160 TaxID=2586637 RepID=UPI00111B9369|nr:hypothetical protein [Streptomyces sp. NP160]TNM67372.1 hypothetical protein FHN55_10870 [Streptomyces sp. NP160]
MSVHVRDTPFPRPRRSSAQAARSVWELTAPSPGGRDDIGSFAVQVRRALQVGTSELQVDETACATWSPGQLLVLEHLRRLAHRCGTRWTALPAVPTAPTERCFR